MNQGKSTKFCFLWAILGLMLSACSTAENAGSASGEGNGASARVTTFPGIVLSTGNLVDTVSPPTETGTNGAAALSLTVERADPGKLIVTTWGSSTCPKIPTSITLINDHEISIETQPIYPPGVETVAAPCTADLVATASLVEIPDGINPNNSLTVHLDNESVTLPAG